MSLVQVCTGGEQDLTVSGRGVARDECEPMTMEQCEGGTYGLRITESPQSWTVEAMVAISPVLWMTLQI